MSRPHLLVVMSDDHGPWAMGCAGNAALRTPAMDHLARTGAYLPGAYTPSPVCSPARACFFSGRMPSQHGIHDWLQETGPAKDLPGLHGQPTLAGALRDVGYHTALVGKWHCGQGWRAHEDFDRWISHVGGQYPHFGDHALHDNGQPLPRHGHQHAVLTDEAIRVMRERPTDQPLFLFVGYVNTHSPFAHQPERWVGAYREGDFSDLPREPFAACHGKAKMPAPTDEAAFRELNAQYYAAVSTIDEQLGRLLDELDNQGLADDTLVLYTSDHGHNNGHHGMILKGNGTRPTNFLDESIHVPTVLRWPGHIQPGGVFDQPVSHCDLYRTLLDAAGAHPPADHDGPGRSFLPTLQGQPDDEAWPDVWRCEYGPSRMIRTRTHKYIRRWPGPLHGNVEQLFDLVNDPRETVDLLAQGELPEPHRKPLAELRATLEAWFARYEIDGRRGVDIDRIPQHNHDVAWLADVRTKSDA